MNASKKLLLDTIGSTSNDIKWPWASDKSICESLINCKGLKGLLLVTVILSVKYLSCFIQNKVTTE